jgi:competence protein ComEC
MKLLLSLILGILSGLFFIYFPVISISIALIPFFVNLLNRKYKIAIVCLMLAFLGFLYGIKGNGENISEDRDINFTGYFASSYHNIYFFKTIDSQAIKVYSTEKLKEGRLYRVECKIVRTNKNPYSFNKEKFCYANRIFDEGERRAGFFERIKDRIKEELSKKLAEPTSSVMVAMTTGVRHEISREVREDFQKTGLIHLLSISGAHFSLLFTVFFIIFGMAIRLMPYRLLVRMTLYIKPYQLSIILCFPVLLFYYLLVEPSYPSTRAFIMALFFMTGVLSERKSLWIVSVCIACFLILIIEPSAVKDISFQLSFLATLAIGFVTDFYKEIRSTIKNKLLSYVILSLLISLSASFITAPIVIYRFHYISLISPIANLTAGLLIGMILFPLNIIFVFIYLVTGIYPFPEIVNTIAGFSFKLIHFLASFSLSSISIPPITLGSVVIFYLSVFVLTFSHYIFKESLRKVAIVFALLLIFASAFLSFILNSSKRELTKITFLDVGQADSTVIETSEGVFLIDTGKTGFEVEIYLKAKGYREVQALIISHEQKDHAGGFLRILEKFNVREIWDNGYINYNIPFSVNMRHLERGDLIKFGNCTFTVLHPYREFYTSSVSKDSNELSLVLSLKCYDKTFLFGSDAGIEALSSIPASYLKADIVKIPHHGSKCSFYDELYNAVSPTICVISAGKNNPYGHPHEKVVEHLKNKCKIYRTDLDGAIQIEENKNGQIKIKTFDEAEFKPYRELENLKKLFVLW